MSISAVSRTLSAGESVGCVLDVLYLVSVSRILSPIPLDWESVRTYVSLLVAFDTAFLDNPFWFTTLPWLRIELFVFSLALILFRGEPSTFDLIDSPASGPLCLFRLGPCALCVWMPVVPELVVAKALSRRSSTQASTSCRTASCHAMLLFDLRVERCDGEGGSLSAVKGGWSRVGCVVAISVSGLASVVVEVCRPGICSPVSSA